MLILRSLTLLSMTMRHNETQTDPTLCRIHQDKIDGRNLELEHKLSSIGYYEDGEDVRFVCKEGFRSVTGSLAGKCQNAEINYPTCIPETRCLIDEAKLEESNLGLDPRYPIKDYYEDGENVRFRCKSGFIRSTASLMRRCVNNSLPVPRCLRIESSA